jgi:polyvinyl alcohol dehydrogenase (cytochrome)
MAEPALRSRAFRCGTIASGMIVCLTTVALGDNTGNWPMGGQNFDNSRSQNMSNITRANAGKLKPAWVFTTKGDVTATPAIVGGTVYFPDFAGNFYAVAANSGALQWSKTVSSWTGVPGDYARNDPAIDGSMLILGDQAGALARWTLAGGLTGAGAKVIAVNRNTGALIWSTQVDAFPAAFVTSSPVIDNGVVYVGVATAEESTAATPNYPCCTSSGSMVALAESSGKILWQTKMVPNGYSGGSIWDSTPVIDAARNSVYVGTGNNFSVPQSVKDCFANNMNNPNCTASNDYFDAVIALDLKTGAIKWANRAMYYDTWNVSCIFAPAGAGNCPKPEGPDYDFGGSGPNMLRVGNGPDLLGIGEKSGIYWALNPDTGSVAWWTQVGPGSSLGGIEWGTAFDGSRIYVPIANLNRVTYALQPSGTIVNGGSWAALDPRTGAIIWQTGTPGSSMALGPASVTNGVVFAGSMDVNSANPTMFALDATTGSVLWSYAPGSSVNAAPAIAGNMLFWGSGYSHFGPSLGTGNTKLFAFSVQ